MRPNERTPALVLVLFAIGAGLALLYLLVRILDVPSDTLMIWTDLDDESSVATWFSTLQLALAGLLLTPVILTDMAAKERHAPALLLLGLAFLGLSADESISFHEWLGIQTDAFLPENDRRVTFFRTSGIWMFLIGVPFAIGLALLLRGLRRSFGRVRGVQSMLVLGACVWLGGALGIEFLVNLVEEGAALAVAQVFFEELAEMLGVTVMILAIVRLLRGLGFRWHLAEPGRPLAADGPDVLEGVARS